MNTIDHILNHPVQSAHKSTMTRLWGIPILKLDTDQMLLKSDLATSCLYDLVIVMLISVSQEYNLGTKTFLQIFQCSWSQKPRIILKWLKLPYEDCFVLW